MTIKNILILGKTGNGKSTLANVLTGTKKFTESSKSVSQTKSLQYGYFDHNNQKYQVIDTIGLADTSLSEKEVLYKLADIAEYLDDNNLCQVLLVIDKRITEEELKIFKLLKEIVLDQDTKELVTIIRTHFDDFEDEEAKAEDKEALASESEETANLVNNCRDILYVNNPSISEKQRKTAISTAEELREASRKIVVDYLDPLTNHSIIKLNTLGERIKDYRSFDEHLKNKVRKLKISQAEYEAKIKELWEELEENKQYYSKKAEELEKERQRRLNAEAEENKRKDEVENLKDQLEELKKGMKEIVTKFEEKFKLDEGQREREFQLQQEQRERENINRNVETICTVIATATTVAGMFRRR